MVLPQDTIYVRVKRKNQTFFVLCTPNEKVKMVILKIAKILDRDPKLIRLLRRDRNGTSIVIQEDANLRDQNVGVAGGGPAGGAGGGNGRPVEGNVEEELVASIQGMDMDRIKTALTRAKKADIDKEHIRAAERKLAKLVDVSEIIEVVFSTDGTNWEAPGYEELEAIAPPEPAAPAP
jgi:hypothetical protein